MSRIPRPELRAPVVPDRVVAMLPHARQARLRRDEHGSHTLQMAIIVPGILLLVFTIFQASMYYWAKSVASAAARQGATAASRDDAAGSVGAARAREFLDGPGGDVLRGAEISVDRDATQVSVTVEGSAVGPIPGMWHVSQTSTLPIEEFTSDEEVAD
jgi:TadE-like protein